MSPRPALVALGRLVMSLGSARSGGRPRLPRSPIRLRRNVIRVALLVWPALLASASAAHAHVETGQAAGFLAGLAHPVSGLDHVVAMIAVGLWGAQLGAPAVWGLPVTFPMVMALGGMLGLLGLPVPGVEIGIAASALLLGLAVSSALRPPLAAAVALVAAFAVFHGHAHGVELPPGQSALLYSMGFVVATGGLHAIGIAVGLVHGWPWGPALLRMAGAVVAVAGAVFMWRAIA